MSEKDTIRDNAIAAICGIIGEGGTWDDVKYNDAVLAAVEHGFDLDYIKDA